MTVGPPCRSTTPTRKGTDVFLRRLPRPPRPLEQDQHPIPPTLFTTGGSYNDTNLAKTLSSACTSAVPKVGQQPGRLTRACVPTFRAQGRGRVINVTSYTGLHGNVGQANYAAAKAGIIGFTKTTAKELARFGVTVNAISPNAETRMIASIPDEKRAELAAAIPMGRFADPSEMCAAIGFLASDEAAYITGVVLPVDGGISI
ncbi:SDR family oxidoreductase [Amycolatopsis sp. NPDC047767]|uniref:SDR family oxidoreductase n=1 Tax=Amycolatopsis sp. NPDC047767 TaxID=3156765 RepID=UPI003456582E